MNKNFIKLFFVLCVFTTGNVFAQAPTKTAEKLTNTPIGKPSMEDENGYTQDSSFILKKNSKYNRIPPKYPELRKEDVLFTETIWEDIDGREKKNRLFIYDKEDETGNQKFYEILLRILDTDSANVRAYSDERFTSVIPKDTLLDILKGPLVRKAFPPEPPATDTVWKVFRNSTANEVPLVDKIYTFRFKAQYIFDSRTSRMHYRIIGIAPIAMIEGKVPRTEKDGSTTEVDSTYQKTLFWLSYPKLRNHLANYMVYNPNNQMKQVAWSDLLEARYFDGHIVKSSTGNFNNKDLFSTIKDPKKRLQASEKIRERIDDYEQDRWVY